METTSSPLDFLLLHQVEFSQVNDDLLPHWELVDLLDFEQQEEESEHVEQVDQNDAVQKKTTSWVSAISWSLSPTSDPIQALHFQPPKLKDDSDDDTDGRRFDGDVVEEGSESGDADSGGYGGEEYDDDDVDDDVDDEDDVDAYDGYDLDDELVPWCVNAKFERQRMRKLGKRAFSKMHNSKRSPILFVRPGCVRGKHGLGLKHNY